MWSPNISSPLPARSAAGAQFAITYCSLARLSHDTKGSLSNAGTAAVLPI
jgi:hypothetical protein